jgi:hypothetical protein
MTIVNPPPVQEMRTVENHASTSGNEAPKAEHDDVEEYLSRRASI